ncbi:BadF/BadG/BcrA/BcrD ATPase family protein [Pararhizobium sp.]|uniref:BadF/BadG/BcrA/BcrD ATPase family protein n=1 Tax=Pararhizobium sp. TaxID=1977563 RepID=UPI002722F831|nr:BadF/BadG/BcrA/BcrD ATPase family protein [Pararhizobium sp.]MDO9418166.1 BadF/BadG/BcrA/BcrD ATPase family protein [Pararhizobium sp.]
MSNFILGIDGGGTSCRAAVATADGHVIGRGVSGAANILTDADTALIHIIDCARAAFANAGLGSDDMSAASAVLGLAGANVGDVAHYVRERLPFSSADIESDGLIALQGALGEHDGAVAILGTGSVFMSRTLQTVRYVGGWGFIVGDLGGGARIGQALLQETLLAHDHVRPASRLTETILAEFDNTPGKLVEFARTARPGDFGRFAPMVFDHAGIGDVVAITLIEAAARSVDAALDTITAGGCNRLCLLGGLSSLYPLWLAQHHRTILFEPEADALAGAVSLAAIRHGNRQERIA